MNSIDEMVLTGRVAAWMQVPKLVAHRYKTAASTVSKIKSKIKELDCMDYGYCYYHPETKEVWAVLCDGDSGEVHDLWKKELAAIPGVKSVKTESEVGPPDEEEWTRIKRSSALEWLGKPYQAAGVFTGGPSALSNSIVSGLLGAGLGYGAGTVAESLLPSQYFDRGKLRKNLALLGGVGGAGLHIPQVLANMQINQHNSGDPQTLRSLIGPTGSQVPNEQTADFYDFMRAKEGSSHPMFKAATENFVKESSFFSPVSVGNAVPVDTLNQAIWSGATSGPSNIQHAAAASGLVTGVQQMYGGASALSPMHFVKGLATAGVDMATARIAGGVLGAIGGLKPQAQKQLQQAGIWGGLVRGITGSVLGIR